MKKIFAILMIILSSNVYSQVNTKLMSCNSTGFPFSVQFSGKFATATFKGFSHTAPYVETFIAKNGDTFLVYKSQVIDISTIPNTSYVALYEPNTMHLLASAHCK